jgi:hypothetical protein
VSTVVFVSGDFSSGTTVLFSVFRATGDFHCFYEPLHEKLPEYLVYPLRPDAGHHVHVEPYFKEFKGLRELPRRFRPDWAVGDLYLGPDDDAPELERYLRYLVEAGLRRSERVLLKENRIAFRLGWLRARFPEARIVHIHRDREAQWASMIRRGQEFLGREDIGQDRPDFAGWNIARYCDDLAPRFPELEASRSSSGYERYSKLWELSLAEQRRNADVSVGLEELIADFDAGCARIGRAIGYTFDVERLRPLVVSPPGRAPAASGLRDRGLELLDTLGRKYAKGRVALRYAARGERDAARAVIAGTPGQPRR